LDRQQRQTRTTQLSINTETMSTTNTTSPTLHAKRTVYTSDTLQVYHSAFHNDDLSEVDSSGSVSVRRIYTSGISHDPMVISGREDIAALRDACERALAHMAAEEERLSR
jgi:hypothetical protein